MTKLNQSKARQLPTYDVVEANARVQILLMLINHKTVSRAELERLLDGDTGLFAKALTRLQIEGERDGSPYTIRPLREGEAYELRRRTVN